jgi:Cu-processing system ATP-binding protein
MITIKNLQKAFQQNQVLKGIDLNIDQPGKITAILGPNGSGKTTLIKCILGMVLPDQGSIEVQGNKITGASEYRQHIDYLPQIARFPENLKVIELIHFIKDIRGTVGDEKELIQLFQLQPFLNKRLGNLSGGTRQKVNLVLTFMNNGDYLILDEPTSGLDPVAMVSLRSIIQQRKKMGKSILVTTHIMSFVEEIADEIIFLLEGKIYFHGTLSDLKKQCKETNIERAIAHILRNSTSLPNQAPIESTPASINL